MDTCGQLETSNIWYARFKGQCCPAFNPYFKVFGGLKAPGATHGNFQPSRAPDRWGSTPASPLQRVMRITRIESKLKKPAPSKHRFLREPACQSNASESQSKAVGQSPAIRIPNSTEVPPDHGMYRTANCPSHDQVADAMFSTHDAWGILDTGAWSHQNSNWQWTCRSVFAKPECQGPWSSQALHVRSHIQVRQPRDS